MNAVAYRVLADVVIVLHFAFILFVAFGALLALRWPRLVWAHIPCVAYAVGIAVFGFVCPLTPLEKELRSAAGDEGYAGGFVDQYIENVIYPEEYTSLLRALAAVLIVAGYALLARRHLRRPAAEDVTAEAAQEEVDAPTRAPH